MKTKIIIILSFLTLSLAPSFSQDNEAILTSIETLIIDHFETYKTNPRQKTTKLGGGWVNEKFTLEGDYIYDVQQTNSLLSAFTAYCEFALKRSITKFHSTKEEATIDSVFIDSDVTKHKHYYAYQKGKWIVSKREHEGYNRWYDCGKIITTGENEGQKDVYGCWEYNFTE